MDLGHLVQLLVTLEHKQGEDKWHKLLEMEDDVVPDPISKLESATASSRERAPRPLPHGARRLRALLLSAAVKPVAPSSAKQEIGA